MTKKTPARATAQTLREIADVFLAAYGDEPPFTDQPAEHGGDALEALDRLVRMAVGDELVCKHGKAQAVAETVRRHLTADKPCPHVRTSGEGTSYCTLAESSSAVPEQIRRLPAKWDKEWERQDGISARDCIDDLEKALASAPAVPDEWMWFPVEAWKFLSGEGALAGYHFGDVVCDDKTGRRKPYWWRSHIRSMLAAAPTKGEQS